MAAPLNARPGMLLDPGAPINSGLVGWWPMWEGAGGKCLDISGKNNHGTLTNGPLWAGGGLKFDGVDDHVIAPLVSSKVNDFSFAFWLNVKVASDNRGAVFFNGSGANGYGFFAGSVDGTTTTEFVFLAQSLYWQNTNVGWTQNAWHHIVATLDSSNVWRLYKDGALVFTSSPKTVLNTPTVDTTLGAEAAGAQTVDHSLDNVRMFDRVLSADEVRRLYVNPNAGLWTPDYARYYVAAAAGGADVRNHIIPAYYRAA